MFSLSPPPPLPPSPSPPKHHLPLQQTQTYNTHLHKKPITSSIPDFIFTAFSIFFLFSSSSPKPTSAPVNVIHKFPFPLNPRKFFRIPIMSSPSSRAPNRFPNPQSLSDWLKPRLPSDSFASWGVKPGTKNVHNLWLELSEGETTLLADSTPPIRTVDVVIVRVIGGEQNNKLLLESHQELSNGHVRNRCRPLSEKMKPGESVEAAAFRAVKEELGSVLPEGLDGDIVKIVPNSYSKKVEERASASYPGLPARYVLHTVDAVVEGLPHGEFCTEELEEYDDSDEKRAAHGAVSCKKHYWKWVDSYSDAKI
ncbi:OLC1v1020934C1 [Oldenlandia corymbosa var. corymbosa]|uniref:OLC1v1020934C1 n=1 Tax=Oldenlandia corymbosa var. corymbosa TaxID=529605 RepID=A0AAV1BUJ2_OLDCO|nr:OLC1v1020934C1 [Oldenlandia corymbosa var. corymbosa]